MKKFLLLMLALICASGWAVADDATDSMEAALSSQLQSTASQSSDELNAVAPAVSPAPAVEVPASDSVTAPAKEEPVAVPAAAPAEPLKARDILPESADAADSSEADATGETVLDEEGKEVSVKSVMLEESAKAGKLMLADFDTGDKPNNLGGDFGQWDKDPSDDTQGCRATMASDDSTGNMEGFALRLDYDVDSPSPSYNGFWMKLENVSALPYDTLSLDVRGASHRFTKRLKVELKSPDHRSAAFIVSGITEQWQTIQIPLKRFKGIKDWSVLSELILVFDDVNTAPKKGTLLVDQIRFERHERGMPHQDAATGETGYYLSDNQGPEELINRPS